MTQPGVDPRAEDQPRADHAFEFHGTAAEYFPIWIVNVCLTVVTLGIYSAWAKVRTERYFAASTRLAGASFDYLADPISILKGRLIVIAAVGLYSASAIVSPVLQGALGIALFLALPWAVVRSLAFRAHNTAWRNIRFGFGARYGEAAGAYIGFPILGALTLGILYPYAIYRQRKFIVDHAAFGTTRFAFGSSSRDFYRAFGVVTMLVLLGGVLAAGGFAIGGDEIGPAVAGLLAIPVYFAVFAYLAAAIANLTYQGATLGPHRLSSRLPPPRLGWIYMTNALAILASFGLLIPWSQIRLARFRLSHMSLAAVGSLDEFAAGQGTDVSSLGAEFGEAFDLDVGL